MSQTRKTQKSLHNSSSFTPSPGLIPPGSRLHMTGLVAPWGPSVMFMRYDDAVPPIPPATPPAPPALDTFAIKVNGQTRDVTRDELLKLAEKAAGADEKFRQAAEITKKYQGADAALRATELIKGTYTGTMSPDAAVMNEIATLLGIDPKLLMDDEPAPTKTKPAGTKEAPPKLVSLESLDPRLQGLLKGVEENSFETAKTNLKNNCRQAIDSDPVLAKMIKVLPDKERQEITAMLYDMTYDDVSRKILQTQSFDPEMVTDAVARTRTVANRFGMSAKATEDPNLNGILQGLGKSGGLSLSEIQSEKVIQRVPVTDPRYVETTRKRILQKVAQSILGR